VSPLHSLDYGIDVDTVTPPEPLTRALRRRIDGRYPVDPFGMDPHFGDLVSPVLDFLVRVEVHGGEHVPTSGSAVLVSNRGFGVFEPAAVAVAVRKVANRRLRIVGAPTWPIIGGLARRLGGVSASPRDVAGPLRAGHLVGVPLAPTWWRTGAGTPPLPLMAAISHARIVPVAVTPGGPFNTSLRPWQVRFGPLVTLSHAYEPDDPLTAAQFAEALRDAVSALIDQT
jgi:1-acyl-sn-glycerol-3-phosphate acyltransferase